MSQIADNLSQVQHRIERASQQCHRNPHDILLLAVSKRHPISAINDAYDAGQRHFGENYAQEALEKIDALKDLAIHWHFIGPIQSNKTRIIAENFHWVHTIDRIKIAERLAQQRPEHLPPLNVCIQVNIDDEDSKSGVALDEVDALVQKINTYPQLTLRGLMAIPKKVADTNNDHAFAKMAMFFSQLPLTQAKGEDTFRHWDTLSMGMSSDLEHAIANNANLLRIGTDIFGARR